MPSIVIPCPECGSSLKLPDRTLLGRRGRCPSCQHTFVLTAPEEVELALADADEPVNAVGTSARWVPDSTPQADSQPSAAAEPSGFPGIVTDPAPAAATSRRKQRPARRPRSRRQSGLIFVAVTVLAVSVMGGSLLAYHLLIGPGDSTTTVDSNKADKPAGKAVAGSGDRKPKEAGPDRDPIRLNMVPVGSNIIIQLHPAELWEQGSLGEEFRFCLGPLAEWAGKQLTEMCRYKPAEIDEALICVMLIQRDMQPEISAVIKLKERQKPSVLLERFPGERSEDFAYPVYFDDEKNLVYIRGKDARTIAIGPKDRADEMASSIRRQSVTSSGIEQVLALTDRSKTFTVVFEPRDARNFQEVLIPEGVRPAWNLALDWFSDEEIETVAWSLDLDRDKNEFVSEILLRNHHQGKHVVSPGRLERIIHRRLVSLPVEAWNAARRMKPGEVGPRRIIGRFPAMLQALVWRTRTAVGERHVQLLTRLPERAGPNLALGALLTWDESTRTDFSAPVPDDTPISKPKLPDTIAGRLRRKIEVDFKRTPLQEAIDFIAGETSVRIDIDGDSLKLAGYTKNMPQTFVLGPAPATSVLHRIFEKYDKMVLVVDEAAKRASVTTRAGAEKLGRKPFAVGP